MLQRCTVFSPHKAINEKLRRKLIKRASEGPVQRDDGALKSIFSYLMHLPVTVLKSLPMLLPVAAVSLLKDVDH